MTQLLSSYNAGRVLRDLAKIANFEIKLLSMLFATNILATLFHYVDNILHLHEYPDLPTTQASSIVLFFLVMMPFGLAGYWLYVKNRHKLSYYAFYIYCLLNMVVLGHYTPSRLRGDFWDYSFKVHALIWIEVITAMALLAYVIKLHRSGAGIRFILTPQAFGRVMNEKVRHKFATAIVPIGASTFSSPVVAISNNPG